MAGLIGIGQSGLSAAYAQLQTTGHNIANVNTPGYVRQEVLLESAGGSYTGAGFLGRGVNVADVTRRYDRFIASEVTTGTALAAGDSARAQALGQLDDLLADTQSGLGVAMDDLRSALADLVNQPAASTTRDVVLQRAEALAVQFRATSQRMAQLGVEADLRIADSVEAVNGRLDAIADLNRLIATAQATGKQPSDLLDQRDRLIDEVAGTLQVSRLEQADGSVSLFAASGQPLVAGGTASRLATRADPQDPARLQVVFEVSGNRIPADVGALGTGKLAGLMRFRDQDLASAQGRLGQLAAAVAGAYNGQQALGFDADGNAGAPLFGPMSVAATAAAGNVGDAALSVAVEDPAALRASDYRLSFDGSAYQLERLPDGGVTSLAALPASVDGLRIELASGSMTIGDRITIRGASGFAAQMSLALTDGDGLATGATNVDSATDNRNARALAALGDAPLVAGATFTDAFAALVADVGGRTAQAQAAAEGSGALLSHARAAFAAESGVNLDEEAARLLQYQQAYQAAARVIATANSMFDTVLSVVSR
ncbi:MAG: flagellar hook-associated protein FlgK [Burkholderiaceae bacterium]|nr:flagellar hook-associated protein FlgK [Burkholderiaceae bacterium]